MEYFEGSPSVAGFQKGALAVFSFGVLISTIGTPYPRDQILQHAPTVLTVAVLLVSTGRFPLSNRSFLLILAFYALHALGARYIYSYVPYDTWAESLFGRPVSSVFGFERNHYDRLVHFSFGLLLVYPAREIFLRLAAVSPRWGWWFGIEFIAAGAMLYELGEWLVALTFAPDWADRYLGQQGDPWDGQKDMALAFLGATLTAASCAALIGREPRATCGSCAE